MSTTVAPAGEALALLRDRPLVVLTGAGLSTDSGIPDYRGPGSPARMPMTYQEFVSGPRARQRYWARSHLGWGRMKSAEPNAGHLAPILVRGNTLSTLDSTGTVVVSEATLTLSGATTITGNQAEQGGGISNRPLSTVLASNWTWSISGNTPDQCNPTLTIGSTTCGA